MIYSSTRDRFIKIKTLINPGNPYFLRTIVTKIYFNMKSKFVREKKFNFTTKLISNSFLLFLEVFRKQILTFNHTKSFFAFHLFVLKIID